LLDALFRAPFAFASGEEKQILNVQKENSKIKAINYKKNGN